MTNHELKELRLSHGKKALDFSAMVGVAYSSYSMMEKGGRGITPIQAFKIRLALSEIKPEAMDRKELLTLIQDLIED